MGMNNGEVAEKTLSLSIKAAKITKDLVMAAMNEFLRGNTHSRGKVSLNTLAKGGKIEAIEVSNENISDFRRTAAKYDVNYAIAKNPENSTYYVMFSAAKAKNIERAFREYASDKVAALNETQFSRAGQKVFRERAEQLAVENKGHRLERKNEKVIERG